MTTLMDEAVDVGTTIRLTESFATLGPEAVPVDPATVSVRVRDPDGNATSKTVHRDSQGSFYAEFVVTKSGQYRFRWTSSVPTRAREGSFLVRRSEYSEGGIVELFVTYNDWQHLTEDDLATLNYGNF